MATEEKMATMVDVGNLTKVMTSAVLDKARASKNQSSEDSDKINEAAAAAAAAAAEAENIYQEGKLELAVAEEKLLKLITKKEDSRVLSLHPASRTILDERRQVYHDDHDSANKYAKSLVQLRAMVNDKKTQAEMDSTIARTLAEAAYNAKQDLIDANSDVADAEKQDMKALTDLKPMQNPPKSKTLTVHWGGRRRTNKKRYTRRKKRRGKKTRKYKRKY